MDVKTKVIEALAQLISSDQFAASIYAFDLVQKRAKRPVGAPDKTLAKKVTKVGIIGAGLMASQFALLFVRKLKVPVLITDLDQARPARQAVEAPEFGGRFDLHKLITADVNAAIKRPSAASFTGSVAVGDVQAMQGIQPTAPVAAPVAEPVEAEAADGDDPDGTTRVDAPEPTGQED